MGTVTCSHSLTAYVGLSVLPWFLAPKGLLPRVRRHMPRQLAGLGEHLSAMLTLMFPLSALQQLNMIPIIILRIGLRLGGVLVLAARTPLFQPAGSATPSRAAAAIVPTAKGGWGGRCRRCCWRFWSQGSRNRYGVVR